MLNRIFIQNIALIDKLDVEFEPGFNVLTGETGAGKSIIIDSVNLVLGERADRELIGSHAQKALVEAVFSVDDSAVAEALDELGFLPEDGELLLSRELSVAGKNTVRINGRLATLAVLQEVSRLLVDVYGQHEHQSLLNPGEHLKLLDGFGEEKLKPLLDNVQSAAEAVFRLEAIQKGASGSAEEIDREMGELRGQIKEIAAARLIEGEEQALSEESNLLENAEEIARALSDGYDALYGSEAGNACAALRDASTSLSVLAQIDASFQALSARLEEAYYTAEDIAFELRDKKGIVESDPFRLEEIQARLSIIERLGRKYGSGTKNILQYHNNALDKIKQLEDNKMDAEQLGERLALAKAKWRKEALALSEARKEVFEGLKAALEAELHQLGMQSARFSAVFSESERITRNGRDSIEFLLSTNKGEALKPLHKVASGGEMSRIMLALKTIGANIAGVDTLIFDEIDAGISGRTAYVVGEKLFGISGSRQILCVTHQAQIAALADAHYEISKDEVGDRTFTTLQKLDKAQRIMEISRLIGAENSSSGQSHAKELIEKAARLKRV